MKAEQILGRTLGQLLERVFSESASVDVDPWVDAATAPCGWRHILDAAKRGELEASRIGRKVLVRRSELDRWIAAQRIPLRDTSTPAAAPANGVGHLLERAGYAKKPGSGQR